MLGVLYIGAIDKIRNNLIEIFIAIIAIIVFILVIYFKIRTDNTQISTIGENYEIIITFFSSFIFSWILTKYAGDIQLKEREKDLAIRSFRHSRNLISKIDYSIKISDLLSENSSKCSNGNQFNCQFYSSLKRTRDLLITFKKDSTEIKNDWSDVISRDIICHQEIERIDKQIKELSAKTQDEMSTDADIEKYGDKIKKLNNMKDKYIKQADHRVELALTEQSRIDDEILDYINTEKKFNDVRYNKIGPKVDYNIPSKESYTGEKNIMKDANNQTSNLG